MSRLSDRQLRNIYNRLHTAFGDKIGTYELLSHQQIMVQLRDISIMHHLDKQILGDAEVVRTGSWLTIYA